MRFIRDPRPPSLARLLGGLRPVPGYGPPAPDPVVCEPYDPAWDPCGGVPIEVTGRRKAGRKTATTRRAAS